MRRLAAALLASTFLCAPGAARAEPVSTAIGLTAIISSTFAVSAATAGAIGGAIIGTGVAIGASLISNALAPEQTPQDEPSRGTDLSVQYGGALPRQAMMGPGATGGHLVYTNVYGNNEYLQCVFVVGDGLHGDLTRIWYNGKSCNISGPVGHGSFELTDFTDTNSGAHVWVRWFRGEDDQSADEQLVDEANPAGRWTSEHRGRGVCYLSVTQKYNEELGLVSVPQVLIEHEGLVVYDPRKDSTNGGSGAHRWGQPATYEPSANPAIQEYNFRRGISIAGQRVLGMQVSPVNLLLSMYVAAANACDEDVPLKEGGNEPRYRCSVGLADDRQHSQTLEVIRASMAGFSMERAGQFGPLAGVAQVAITDLAFGDDDLQVGSAAPFTKYRSRSEAATAIHGKFSDPAQKWTAVAFPARENPADDALFGDKLARDMDLTQVFSSSQAQRVAEIARRRSLQQGKGSVMLGAKWIAVQPGDWLPFNSGRHGDMTVLVTGVRIDPANHNVGITYERISSSVYSWTTAGELDPPAIPTGGQPSGLATAAQNMMAVGVSLPGDNDLVRPGIHFTWDPVLDPSVERVMFEIRKVGDSGTMPFTSHFPPSGTAVASEGIQANTSYEYRHRLQTMPVRATPWSDWTTVLSGTEHVVPNANFALALALEAFSERVARMVTDIVQPAIDFRGEVEDFMAEVARRQDSRNWLDKLSNKELVRRREEAIRATVGDVEAGVTTLAEAFADSEDAFASYQVTVDTRFDTNEASISTNATAITNANTAFSSYQTTVNATLGSHTTSITTNATAIATVDGKLVGVATLTLNVAGKLTGYKVYNDGSTSNFDIEADNFRVGRASSGASFVPIFQVTTVSGSTKIAVRGDVIADGALIARMVTAGMINATGIIVNGVIITDNFVNDAATRLDLLTASSSTVDFDNNFDTVLNDSFSVSSAGAKVLFVASVEIDDEVGAFTDARDADLECEVLVDGSPEKQILVPAIIYASGSPGAVRVAGHFETSLVRTLSSGGHTAGIRIRSRFNKPALGSFTVQSASIVLFHAKKQS